MRIVLCAIVAVFCLMLIFPAGVQADGTAEEVADLRRQLAAIQLKIDVATTQQTIGIANAPLGEVAMAATVGQSCANGSCAVGQSYSSSSVRASVRSGERRGLFRGRLFGGRRGGC